MGSNPAGRAKDQRLRAGFCRPYFLLHDFARLFRARPSCRHPQQRDRRRCKTAIDLVDRVNQLGQLDCAVMCRDIAIRVPETLQSVSRIAG